MSNQPQILKAFHVQGDEYGCIRFAASNVVARREGANELDEDFNCVTCKRIPDADKYASQGQVPARALVEDLGWWQECGYCNCHVDNETEGRVWDEGTIYCDIECEARLMNLRSDVEKERQRIKAAEQTAIEAAIAKFPGISDVTAHHNFKKEVDVYFRFPGGAGRASWTLGGDFVGTGRADGEPFKAYLASIRQEGAA
ncbi:hypothetical protein MUU49_19460 [Scandinavium goeteborgense]|uniref:hypothetical protein n=1 Tax=Scandinavium goeteborgense TaxID=1851514 RepID=UPI002165B234|nr:hypothetical protein [Scandinavium goeteborgense]MCS2154733.1 hypothetical protein [Scandinavium goeteborgense]